MSFKGFVTKVNTELGYVFIETKKLKEDLFLTNDAKIDNGNFLNLMEGTKVKVIEFKNTDRGPLATHIEIVSKEE